MASTGSQRAPVLATKCDSPAGSPQENTRVASVIKRRKRRRPPPQNRKQAKAVYEVAKRIAAAKDESEQQTLIDKLTAICNSDSIFQDDDIHGGEAPTPTCLTMASPTQLTSSSDVSKLLDSLDDAVTAIAPTPSSNSADAEQLVDRFFAAEDSLSAERRDACLPGGRAPSSRPGPVLRALSPDESPTKRVWTSPNASKQPCKFWEGDGYSARTISPLSSHESSSRSSTPIVPGEASQIAS